MVSSNRSAAPFGSPPKGYRFDWSLVHLVLSQIPAGRWTSYGDLANQAGTGARALGQHIRACEECLNAWRVLDGTGVSSPGFRWTDFTRTDTQVDVLLAEGVTFDSAGRANPANRLTLEELNELSADWVGDPGSEPPLMDETRV